MFKQIPFPKHSDLSSRIPKLRMFIVVILLFHVVQRSIFSFSFCMDVLTFNVWVGVWSYMATLILFLTRRYQCMCGCLNSYGDSDWILDSQISTNVLKANIPANRLASIWLAVTAVLAKLDTSSTHRTRPDAKVRCLTVVGCVSYILFLSCYSFQEIGTTNKRYIFHSDLKLVCHARLTFS